MWTFPPEISHRIGNPILWLKYLVDVWSRQPFHERFPLAEDKIFHSLFEKFLIQRHLLWHLRLPRRLVPQKNAKNIAEKIQYSLLGRIDFMKGIFYIGMKMIPEQQIINKSKKTQNDRTFNKIFLEHFVRCRSTCDDMMTPNIYSTSQSARNFQNSNLYFF